MAGIPPSPPLPDLLAPGLDLVFVGINPSVYSARRGHYFARPSNRFWPTLNESGLVPRPFRPEDDADLLAYGIGLTDLVARPTPRVEDVTDAEFAAGRIILRDKLRRYSPRAVCFVGKVAYQRFSGQVRVGYGLQRERFDSMALFVMPSTSGRANRLHAERQRCLAEVRAFLGR